MKLIKVSKRCPLHSCRPQWGIVWHSVNDLGRVSDFMYISSFHHIYYFYMFRNIMQTFVTWLSDLQFCPKNSIYISPKLPFIHHAHGLASLFLFISHDLVLQSIYCSYSYIIIFSHFFTATCSITFPLLIKRCYKWLRLHLRYCVEGTSVLPKQF